MSITNLSPPFKGSGQGMMNTVEGSMQGVKAEIQELEQKIKSRQMKNPGPLPRATGEPLPCLGGSARGTWGLEGRGDSQSPSTPDFPMGYP